MVEMTFYREVYVEQNSCHWFKNQIEVLGARSLCFCCIHLTGKVVNGPEASMIKNREVKTEREANTGNPPELFGDASNNLRVQNVSNSPGPCPVDSGNLFQGISTVPMLKLWSYIKSQRHLPPLLAISFAVILLMQVCTFLTEALDDRLLDLET